MTRILRILAALAVLAILSSCGGRVSNRPPSDRKVDPKRERVVAINADSNGPYTVLVIATDEQGGFDRTGPLHIAGGEYKQSLKYTSGRRIEIRMTVRGHPHDTMSCEIIDGDNVDKRRGPGEVFCQVTTRR